MVDVCFVCSVCGFGLGGWARGARDGIENRRTRVNDDLWGVEAGYVARKSFVVLQTQIMHSSRQHQPLAARVWQQVS